MDKKQQNNELYAALNGALQVPHLADNRITNLIEDMVPWDDDNADYVLGRNNHIVTDIMTLMVDHDILQAATVEEIRALIEDSEHHDANEQSYFKAHYEAKSGNQYQPDLGTDIIIDEGSIRYEDKPTYDTKLMSHSDSTYDTKLSEKNLNFVWLLEGNINIGKEEKERVLNRDTTLRVGIADGKAINNNDIPDCSDEQGLPAPSVSQREVKVGNGKNRKPRKVPDPILEHLTGRRIPKGWNEIHIQLWKNETTEDKKNGKAAYSGTYTIESRATLITEDGTTTPKVISKSYFDFVPQEKFKRYLNRFKNKWAKEPIRLFDIPWYKELNDFAIWINSIRKGQALKHPLLISTGHERVKRPNAKKTKNGFYQRYFKDDDRVAAVLLLDDNGRPAKLHLFHGGIEVTFENFTDYQGEGNKGSADYRDTWRR